MKGRKLMVAVVLAFLGFVFLGVSGYLIFKDKSNSTSVEGLSALEEANRKIEMLHLQLEEKNGFEEDNSVVNSTQTALFSQSYGSNMPIVEIVDNDLGEAESSDDDDIKVHRLMYHHQIRFYLLNTGKNALKNVIFSIKDDNDLNKEKVKKSKHSSHIDYMGKNVNNDEMGAYENIEVNTLNLKSKKLLYTSNLPGSFGVGDYFYHIVVEWNQGFYQMMVNVEEEDGKLKYKYEFFDVDGNPIDFKSINTNQLVAKQGI